MRLKRRERHMTHLPRPMRGRYDRDSSGEISRNEVFAMATDKGFNAVHRSLHAAPAPNVPSRGRVHHCGDIVLVGSRRLAAASLLWFGASARGKEAGEAGI